MAQRDGDDIALPARYYARLGALLAERGVLPQALCRRARVGLRRLLDPAGTLRRSEAIRLARAAVALDGAPDLGLRLGAALTPGEHAVLGVALLEAPTLDAALRLLARYFALLSPGFLLRYRLHEGNAEVQVMPRLALPGAVLRLHLDVVLTGLLGELRDLHGRLPAPLTLEHALPPTPGWRQQPLLRGCTARFAIGGAPGFRLWLPRAAVLAPRPHSDARRRQLALQRCEAERATLRGQLPVAAWTAMMLQECADGLPGLDELAALWGCSARSFSRRMQAEGARLRDLQNAARLQRARAALAEGSQPITDIALALGYRDAGNFSRAFRSACGMTPRAWRAGARGQRAAVVQS